MRVYIILVDDYILYRGYLLINEAVNFVKSKPDCPRQSEDNLWTYKSDKHTYRIKEIYIK